jgi:hypothetical protein
MAAKLTRLTHKIAIQLHLVVESCTICSSRSRRPIRKLFDTPLYMKYMIRKRFLISKDGYMLSTHLILYIFLLQIALRRLAKVGYEGHVDHKQNHICKSLNFIIPTCWKYRSLNCNRHQIHVMENCKYMYDGYLKSLQYIFWLVLPKTRNNNIKRYEI